MPFEALWCAKAKKYRFHLFWGVIIAARRVPQVAQPCGQFGAVAYPPRHLVGGGMGCEVGEIHHRQLTLRVASYSHTACPLFPNPLFASPKQGVCEA